MQIRSWTSYIVALAVGLGVLGCGKDAKHTGGEAKCLKVKRGQRYSAVKRIFGRQEDARRGSNLAHVRTWKFGKGRCEVPFSGIGVRRDARWHSGAVPSDKRPRPVAMDCEVLVQKQKTCVDALLKRGAAEMLKSIRARIAKLPASVQQQRLAAVEQTQKQLGQLMRQQLVGPSARSSCERSYGRTRLGPEAQREAKQLRACLKLTACTAYARCYWKLVGAKRVGGAPHR